MQNARNGMLMKIRSLCRFYGVYCTGKKRPTYYLSEAADFKLINSGALCLTELSIR